MTDSQDIEKPLIEHLLELRSCLLRGLLAWLLVFIGLVYFANDIYSFVAQPLMVFLPEGSSMIATDVTATFFTPFKLTLFVAAVVTMPYWLFQLWRYIGPALYYNERRLAVPLLLSSVMLFYLGMAFAYLGGFAHWHSLFFVAVSPEGVTVMTDISSYLGFILKLFFAFGVAFEIPSGYHIVVVARSH